MKRIISLVLAFSMFIVMIIPGFTAGTVKVEKVIFSGLNSSAEYPSLGGIRFYNEAGLVDSGAPISAGDTVGETEYLTASSSSSYSGTDARYKLTNALDTSKTQQPSNYNDGAYWIAARKSVDQTFEVGFKTATEVSKIEFVPQPGSYTNHSTTEPFNIEVVYSNGVSQTYDITPATTRNEIQTLELMTILLPEAPTELNAQIVDESIALTWGNVSEADGYNLYRTVSGGAIELIGSNLLVPKYTDQAVSRGVQYQYFVTTIIDGVESEQSQSVIIEIPEPSAPSAPVGILAEIIDDSIRLDWDKVNEAESYSVYRLSEAGGTPLLLEKDIVETNYTDITASKGINYLYYVTSFGDGFESAQSNQVSAMIPEPVLNNMILKLYLDNHQIKEYELNSNDFSDFIEWFEDASSGSGDTYYVFTKTYAIGPYESVKEYIVFDKIVSFETLEY